MSVGDPTAVREHARELRFPRYRLTVIAGPELGQSIDGAAEEIAIGTAQANDLVLTDPMVSRHHVAIAPTTRGLLVRDLGSTNGTAIGNTTIERAYLGAGGVLALGDTKIQLEPLADEASEPLASDQRWGSALGASSAMRRLFAALPRLASSDATILLEGETGTGKGLLAAAIHEASRRSSGPFVVVDCGSIPPTLIESELFGHEKGAFTGASAARVGAFEAARGGTLFLDEIGELPLDMQPKLLRALEERIVKRVGGRDDIKLDIRVIAATNRDLRSAINRGQFRSDVYYRLNTVRLRVPPLRERRDDIPLLVAHFYGQLAPNEQPPAELLATLSRHDWPGNVRELRSAVERIVLLGDPAVWQEISEASATAPHEPVVLDGSSFRVAKERAVADWEREYVRALIAAHGGNLSRAARAVRMDRNHLRELLVKHKIRAEES